MIVGSSQVYSFFFEVFGKIGIMKNNGGNLGWHDIHGTKAFFEKNLFAREDVGWLSNSTPEEGWISNHMVGF
jgi:hypothetical protein